MQPGTRTEPQNIRFRREFFGEDIANAEERLEGWRQLKETIHNRRNSVDIVFDNPVGGKQAVGLIARAIPVVGGGVGAATDSWNTLAVGRYAREQFVSRRPADNSAAPEQ